MTIELPDEVYNLDIGQTAGGLVCPTCKGGSNRDRSFSCTRVERGFVFKCHREKCDERGFCPDAAGLELRLREGWPSGASPQLPRKEFTRPIESTTAEVAELVRQRYRIEPATLSAFGVGWSPPQEDRVGRLVIPVVRPDGSSGGLVARALDKSEEPKSLTYIPRPGCMSWFLRQQDGGASGRGSVWVVEDQFSAMRLWQEGLSAVALLGTHLNHSRVVEIGSVAGHAPVLLALDRDATNKSVEYAATFRYALNLRVVALTKDIKDMNAEELNEVIRSC